MLEPHSIENINHYTDDAIPLWYILYIKWCKNELDATVVLRDNDNNYQYYRLNNVKGNN
jgi:hypothetical protein